jgi:hypothetical protein
MNEKFEEFSVIELEERVEFGLCGGSGGGGGEGGGTCGHESESAECHIK